MKHSIHLSGILSLYLFLITIVTAQSNKIDSSYFPLNIGNQWSYIVNGGGILPKETHKIITASILNGHLYRIMNIHGPDPVYHFMVSRTQWYRFANDSVFTIFINNTSNDSIEYPIYNLNANVGDTLQTNSLWFGSKIILLSKEDTVTTLSGTYFNCLHFKHIEGSAVGSRTDSWLAKGIGIVKFKELWNNNITYEMDSSSLVTSINEIKTDVNTSTYLLLECYPNPFNPQTTMNYQLKNSGNVLLEIFDILGRKVDQVVNEQKESGSYNVIWNGEKMPSGLYFAVLRSGKHSTTKRLILQK